MSPSIWLFENVHWVIILVVGILFAFPGIPFLRLLTEGKVYSVSYSATWGDAVFILLFALTSYVVQGRGVPSMLVQNGNFHVIVIILAIIPGIVLFLQPDGHITPVDGLHNALIVPLMTYLYVTSALVLAQSGVWWQILYVPVCPLIWYLLVRKDFQEDRIKQLPFVVRTGESFVFGLRTFGKILEKVSGPVVLH